MGAQKIKDEIGVFLDRSLLKKSKITKTEIIRFIEEKWAEADDEKYRVYASYIYAARMVNEYEWMGDAPNMLRWLGEMDKHARSKENPPYVSDYYKGECCLECGAKIGFQFSCSWDMEHGLGVMTRKGKVINIGEAEVAFWLLENRFVLKFAMDHSKYCSTKKCINEEANFKILFSIYIEWLKFYILAPK